MRRTSVLLFLTVMKERRLFRQPQLDVHVLWSSQSIRPDVPNDPDQGRKEKTLIVRKRSPRFFHSSCWNIKYHQQSDGSLQTQRRIFSQTWSRQQRAAEEEAEVTAACRHRGGFSLRSGPDSRELQREEAEDEETVAAMTQFSELHDASSKPWTQLSFFTALVFLLLTQNCSGLPQVVGPSQPVLATVGADVVLSCRLEPAVDASGLSIEWSREDLDPSYVYVWSGGEEQESSKHPDYKGRTSLLFSQLEFGNVSLKLSKVKLSDKGKYRCFIPTLGRGSTVELVVGIDPFPVISLAGLGKTSSSVELLCESAGWYPEPEVLWLDADGNLLSAGPTETVRGPDGFYTVSSRLTVNKKHSNKLTCRVQQNNIKQSREALIQVKDDFFKVQSSYTSTIVGLTVGLTAAFILFILAGFFYTRIQERITNNLVNQQQGEIGQLERNLSGTNNQLQQEKQEKETLKNQLEELKIKHFETKYQLKLEKQKNENLEYELEERDTMMSEVLLKILEDLNDKELSTFQWFLQQPNNVQGLPAINESRLQTPDRRKTVDVMVQTYGLQRAVQVTRVVLEKISRNDLLQRLPSSSSEPEDPRRDTEQRVQPQDWLLSVRKQLVQGLSDFTVDQLLDRLYDQGVISEEEKDVVRAQIGADKTWQFIDRVHRKGPDAVSRLKAALREVDPFICTTLNLM